MATVAKKIGKKKGVKKVIKAKKSKDFGTDPYFVKNARSVETLLKKHGLPAGT